MPTSVRRAKQVVEPAVQGASAAPRPIGLCCAAAALTSSLLWLSHFPASAGWLAWIAIAPWLLLVRADITNWLRYPIAWLAGLGFFVPALQWMRVAHETMFYSWLGLALYCSWYFPLALWFLRRLDRRTGWPLTLTVPLVWTALEFFRSNFAGGFAWYLLGHSQHDYLPVIQIADIAGVAAVTFLVATVNGLGAELLLKRILAPKPIASPWPLRPQWLGVAAGLVAVLGYGAWQLWRNAATDGPRVALLQTNIPQGIRNERDVAGARAQTAEEELIDITRRMAAQAIRNGRPDLLVWPETTFPFDWKEIAKGAPDSPERDLWASDLFGKQQLVRQVADNLGTNALLGLNTEIYGVDGKARRYNSALLVTPNGGPTVARYDKMHLVPFGEYVPFRDTIPLLKKLAPYDYDFNLAFGEKTTHFRITTHDGRSFAFAALICYEDSDAPLARIYAAPGTEPPVDFLVNLSNDGWFMGTSEHEEHLAVSRFRAVECRRALVRAVNMGISAVIDANGRVVALPGATWSGSKGIEAIVTATVPIDRRGSLFAYLSSIGTSTANLNLSDWLPWTCWASIGYGCFWRRSRTHGPG